MALKDGTVVERLLAAGTPTPGLDVLLPLIDRSTAMELHARHQREQAQEREA